MTTTAELLKNKARQSVHCIAPTASVFEAVLKMAEENIGALMVTDNGQVVGMITERDYARKIVLMSRASRDTLVRDIMSSAVIYVRPDQTREECMTLMNKHHLRHLPVMDGEQLVGMISMGDLVKNLISEQRFIIEQMGQYISGAQG